MDLGTTFIIAILLGSIILAAGNFIQAMGHGEGIRLAQRLADVSHHKFSGFLCLTNRSTLLNRLFGGKVPVDVVYGTHFILVYPVQRRQLWAWKSFLTLPLLCTMSPLVEQQLFDTAQGVTPHRVVFNEQGELLIRVDNSIINYSLSVTIIARDSYEKQQLTKIATCMLYTEEPVFKRR